MKFLNTDSKTDLKRFVQAQMLVNYHQIVNFKDIVLLEFGGSKLLVDYLLFKVNGLTYKYYAGKLSPDLEADDFMTIEV